MKGQAFKNKVPKFVQVAAAIFNKKMHISMQCNVLHGTKSRTDRKMRNS